MPRTTPAPPLPLGSLVHRGTRTEPCVECGSDRTTSLAMTLTDGTPVDFVSCRACEARSWTHQGRPLAIDHVLERTRKQR